MKLTTIPSSGPKLIDIHTFDPYCLVGSPEQVLELLKELLLDHPNTVHITYQCENSDYYGSTRDACFVLQRYQTEEEEQLELIKEQERLQSLEDAKKARDKERELKKEEQDKEEYLRLKLKFENKT